MENIREKILAADDLISETVEVPEWEVTVVVRVMTGTERDQYEAEILESREGSISEKLKNMRAKLVVKTSCDENGDRIFTVKDVEELGKKSSIALDRIAEVAQRINGLTEREIKDIAKNSKASGEEDSISE